MSCLRRVLWQFSTPSLFGSRPGWDGNCCCCLCCCCCLLDGAGWEGFLCGVHYDLDGFFGFVLPAAAASATPATPAVCYCGWWFYYFPECISYWVIFRFAFQVMRTARHPAMNCILIRFIMVSRWGPRTNPPHSSRLTAHSSEPDLYGGAKTKTKTQNTEKKRYSAFHKVEQLFIVPIPLRSLEIAVAGCCVNKSLKQKCLRAVH